MDAARWNRIEELLQAALDREPAERDTFLTAACGSDAALRAEIDELLAHESGASFLSRSPSLKLLAQSRDLTGQTISHYRLEAKIGAGGMGEVYEAHDTNLQRTVALKVLPEELASDPERVRRFGQEAFAASRLNHPNIITIFEILHAGEMHFIATERIDGRTVRELLRASPRFGIEQALDVAIQVTEALKAAHAAWIIHRDIKPENIMVRADGLVKVLDFGIAKTNEESAGPPSVGPPTRRTGSAAGVGGATPPPGLTADGAILGTAKYMSPEQARGEALDGRTDLHSLGLVLQEMLGGEPPKDLLRIVRKLLRPNREERYTTAGDLLDELRRAKRNRESRSARRMIGIGVLAVIVAIAVTAIAAVLSVSESWEERVLRDGHTAAARQAVFSPDGRRVLSCSEDGQVILWDFARRERIATFGEPSHKIAWSPDGRWMAMGRVDGTIAIWDPARQVKVAELRSLRSEVTQLAFSPDSSRLASATFVEANLWETGAWRKLAEWTAGSSYGTFLFASDGRYIVSSGTFVVHDVATRRTAGPGQGGANWIDGSPDQTQIAAIEPFGGIAFYRLRDGHVELIEWLPGHQDHGRSIDWSPDGRLVASAAEDIVLWDAATHRKVARFEYPAIVWSVVFSPDGRSLLSTHGDGAVLVWDVAERRCVASFNGHSGSVRAVAFSPDGKRVASGGEDHVVTLWNLGSGRKEAVLAGHATRVTAVAFSNDGALLATTDQHAVLALWDAAAGKLLRVIKPRQRSANYTVRISPDRRFIATTQGVYTLDGHKTFDFIPFDDIGQIYGVDYAPDGRWLATASTGEGTLALWDGATHRMIEKQTLREGTRLITVSVSRDAKWIVTGEDQGAVRLWSTGPLRHVAILGRHAARVKSVAFAPDGRTAASAGDDGMIALWDVKRRRLAARIGTHASPVYAIAFSADGTRLVSGEHDRSVRVYTRHRTLWGFRLE